MIFISVAAYVLVGPPRASVQPSTIQQLGVRKLVVEQQTAEQHISLALVYMPGTRYHTAVYVSVLCTSVFNNKDVPGIYQVAFYHRSVDVTSRE